MSIIIFIVILLVLIIVHEFGHFIAAKKSGIRVDEFGVGFPPRLFARKKGETEYSINAIPFGGFVKIYGENPEEAPAEGPDAERSFSRKPLGIQALVLVMGVVFNIILAWVLFSAGFMIGLPTSAASMPAGRELADAALVVTGVAAGTPAEAAGLAPGDALIAAGAPGALSAVSAPEDVRAAVQSAAERELVLEYERDGESRIVSMTPSASDGGAPAIGISMDVIGTLSLPPHKALIEGAALTGRATGHVAASLFGLLRDAVKGDADAGSLTGPVGIVGVVDDASRFGFANIISLAALISINLAVLNMVPFPALDGGRLLFLLIEWIKGTPVPYRIFSWANAAGFFLLIALMLFVTYHDIVRLF